MNNYGNKFYMERGNQTIVIGSQFCSPQPLQLSIKKKVYFCAGHGYEVKDAYGNLVFTIENLLGFFSSKVLVFDTADIPILTLKSKKFSWHSRWQAFKGDSKNEKDLLFSAKISSIFQFTTKLDVFLANNISEEVCDFRMKTNFMESTCDIFAGQSSTLVAQVKPIFSCFSRININCIHFSKNLNFFLKLKDKYYIYP